MSESPPVAKIVETAGFKRAMQYRDERLSKILSNAGPYPVDGRAGLLVLHLLALGPFGLVQQLTAKAAESLAARQLPALGGGHSVVRTVGTDELLVDGAGKSYAHFTDRGVEAVASGIAPEYLMGGYPVVDGRALAESFRHSISRYADALKSILAPLPFAATMTLIVPEHARLLGRDTEMATRRDTEPTILTAPFEAWAGQLEPVLHRILGP